MLYKIFRFLRQPTRHEEGDSDCGILLLTGCHTASFTYFLKPYFAALGEEIRCVDTGNRAPSEFCLAAYHTVVIVRYLHKPWIRPLAEFSATGGRLIYFMDDDLLDEEALTGLPPEYARKIRRFALRHGFKLKLLCDELWVGSLYLREKYSSWSPRLLQPRPALAQIASSAGITVCYHGTASHRAELSWLVHVVKALQARVSDTQFEVFGDHRINTMFRDLPRATILHPMSWPNYLAYTGSVQRDIALAPLLANPFNAARSPSKFFDFARMGAVGIYTDVAPYRGFIRDGIDGILLPNDPDLWVSTIADLVADVPRRRRMAEAARQRALAMAWDADPMPTEA